MKKTAKRALALLLAIMILCTGLAISASAASGDTVEINYTKNDAKKTITINSLAFISGKEVDGVELNGTVTYAVSPSADKAKDDDGNTFYYNLTPGTTYTISVTVIGSDSNEYTGTAEVSIKKSQNAPTNVKPTAESTTITVATISGAEYMLTDASGNEVAAWQDSNEFTGLTAGTKYVVYARYKETTEALASEATSCACTTLKANTTAPAAPVFDSVTETTITFTAIKNGAYSLDGGKTWQSSTKFTGLTAGTVYYATQKTVDPDGVYTDSPKTDNVKIRTNTAVVYTASFSNIKDPVVSDGNHKATESCSFTAYADIRTSGTTQWGDTRIIPTSIKAVNGSETVTGTVGAAAKDGLSYTCTFTPSVKGTWKLSVVYTVQKYVGSKWQDTTTTYTKTISVSIITNNSTELALLTFFNTIANTIPAMLAKLVNYLSSDGINIIFGYADILEKLNVTEIVSKLMGLVTT